MVAGAASKTAAGTARLEGTVTLERDFDRAVIQHIRGEQDFDAESSHLVMRSPLSEFEPTEEDIVIDAITIARTSYQSIGGLDLPAGKRWIEITPADLGVANGDSASFGSGNRPTGCSSSPACATPGASAATTSAGSRRTGTSSRSTSAGCWS